MADKDITERSLEWFNDVFSDIVNAWLAMNGVKRLRIKPEDLHDALTRTAYKSGGNLREQERDVAKLCIINRLRALICLVGLENQSGIDTWLSLRVLGYDGGDKRQASEEEASSCVHDSALFRH